MRTLDTFDYALIAAVSVLAYLQLPWRPAIRRTLRDTVSTLASVTLSPEIAVVALAITGAFVLVFLVEVLPGRNGPR